MFYRAGLKHGTRSLPYQAQQCMQSDIVQRFFDFSLSGAADRVTRLLAAVQNFAQLDGDQGEAVVAALNVFRGECNALPCCSLCFCLGHKFFGMLSYFQFCNKHYCHSI